jgi:Translation initiation factor 1 (eIF-1/SUI1) and related proteins
MSKNKFSKSLSWSELQSMGRPDAPDLSPTPSQKTSKAKSPSKQQDKVRIYIERKGRGGKTVTLIKGLSLAAPQLDDLCKKLKAKCGVGGKREGREIMIQGDQRKKVMDALLKEGYQDVKNAGS